MGPFQLQTAPYRPALARIGQPRRRMGNLAAMGLTDWALLLGGAVVGGAGVNGVIAQFTGKKKKRPDAIAIVLGLVFAGVGLSVVAQEGQKALA